jgi:hypothetical protein
MFGFSPEMYDNDTDEFHMRIWRYHGKKYAWMIWKQSKTTWLSINYRKNCCYSSIDNEFYKLPFILSLNEKDKQDSVNMFISLLPIVSSEPYR